MKFMRSPVESTRRALLSRALLSFVLLLAVSIPVSRDLLGQTQPLLTVTKTPYESFNSSVDFVNVISIGNAALVSVTSVNRDSGADSTSAIVAASPAPAVVGGTSKVVFRVQGGASGQTHNVSVRASNTSTGETYEGVIQLVIQ